MIRLALSRQRKKLLLLLAFSGVTLLMTAAGSVTSELLNRPEQRADALHEMRGLTRALTHDMTAHERVAWNRIAIDHPIHIIEACTKSPVPDLERHAADR